MKVAINEVEYNVWNLEDFLNVQKVLNGSFSELMKNQAKEEAADEMRTQIIEEYWSEAKQGNNDVQREITQCISDIPRMCDRVIYELSDGEYSSYSDLGYEMDQMKEALESVGSLASDIESIAGDYC